MNQLILPDMKPLILLCFLLACSSAILAQDILHKPVPMQPSMTENWDPVKIISPGSGMAAPSDAVVLFNGQDISHWADKNGASAKWKIDKGELVVVPGSGNIYTRENYEDFQLHIEWSASAEMDANPMKRSNSGILLQDRYEVQVLNSYNSLTYSNGLAGSIYKQTAPLVNISRKPGEWNVFDIIYTAPRFKNDSTLFTPARITLLHNGVVIQNNTVINGATVYTGIPAYKAHGRAPLQLQDHDCPVRYRNIWIREL